jgi:hypothetical protein
MDVVVTVPKVVWKEWLEEGDLPGEPWSGQESYFALSGARPQIRAGERVYVVAFNRLRGYAPFQCFAYPTDQEFSRRYALVRHGYAVAVTIDREIRGFQGWRYRSWSYDAERPFPDWKLP